MLIDSEHRIITTDGYQTDENNALDELIIPSHVKTVAIPSKVTFEGTTLNWIPSTTGLLQEFSAPNCPQITNNSFKGYTALTVVNFPVLTALNDSATADNTGFFYGCSSLMSVNLPMLTTINKPGGTGGVFRGCTSLTSISLPALQSISSRAGNGGAFSGCTGLTAISLPALTSITDHSGWGSSGTFYNCTSLTSINFPELTQIVNTSSNNVAVGTFRGCTGLISVCFPALVTTTSGSSYAAVFGGCTSLETVQLGSAGHAVTSLGVSTFSNCTQSGLTITIYTTNGASLANEPWGATNADIVYETA